MHSFQHNFDLKKKQNYAASSVRFFERLKLTSKIVSSSAVKAVSSR